MSGHSKWSQIKHKKGLTDKKKSQAFGRLSRLVTIAARKGSDPKSNISLAQAIKNAEVANMPKDNIARAIKKVGEKSSDQLEELTIEAIGPSGIALRIKATTDNRNRTIAEVKSILTQQAYKMVTPGSIDWIFKQPAPAINQEAINEVDTLLELLGDHDDIEDIITNLDQQS